MFDSMQDAIDFANEEKRRDNDGGVPRFYMKAVAIRKGEEVDWEDQVWVEIFNKGDPKNIMERNKRPEDETRWPNFWKAFQEDREPDIDGIPLSEFPQITPAERERCKRLRLLSVEDLAAYPDGQVKDLGGRGFALKRAAQEFVDYREGESITDLKDRIAKLEKELKSGNSTDDHTKRSSGDKSPETDSPDEGRGGARRESLPTIGDQLSSSREDGLASVSEGTRVHPDKEPG